MNTRRIVLLCIGIVLFTFGCKEKDRRIIDVSTISIDLPVERLERELFACQSEEEVHNFLNRYPALAAVYFPDLPVPTVELAQRIYQSISNPALIDFKTQLDSIFSDMDKSVIEPLETAFRHLKYYYPDASIPKVQTMVTGFLGSDLYVSDSLIIVGLDFFGGPSARFRPDIYLYQLRRYDRHYIAPSVMFIRAQQYNRLNPDDRTLLADMIWFGKNYEFVRHMMPTVPDSLILGFSQEHLSKAVVSQTDIWAHFTTNRLLYEQVEQKKQKYVGERPITYEIGEDVPGGIGRWVGWRIVNRLLETNPEMSIKELMENDNPRNILEESGYKGQRE